MIRNHINSILIALLFWNPLLILLLSRSWSITFFILLILILLAYHVSKFQSLRIKVWAFNLCAISSIALHGELLFREFFSDKSIPNLYKLHGKYYFNKPFLELNFKTNEYASTYKTNYQGYRMGNLSNPYDTIKTCDWLFVGDSFTQGAQVEYSELFTTLLFSSFPDKIIVNGGMSGAGLYDELNFFKDKGRFLFPKTVFLQIGVFNDFFNIKEHYAMHQDYLLATSELYRFLAYNVFSTDSLPLGRWTEPFFPTEEDNRKYNILYKEDSEIKKADKVAFRECIKEWKNEVEKVGAKLILLLIPSKEQISPVLLKSVMDKYHIPMEKIDLTAPNRLLKEVAISLGLQSIDLTDAFRKSNQFPFFKIDEHLNSIGHSLIATIIADSLSVYDKSIKLVSPYCCHERYPFFLAADSTILFQSQDANQYYINKMSYKGDSRHVIIKSYEELIHPAISNDAHYLAYTEGNQEYGETDVILYDMITDQNRKVNPDGHFAAIPMFSHSCDKIALPIWKYNHNDVANICIYDIHKRIIVKKIESSKECWRPVFSKNDKEVYFIEKDENFIVKKYNIEKEVTETILALPYNIWDIAISPSGNYMVFAGNKDGNWDLFCYTFSTKSIQQLTQTKGNEWDPAFGPTDNDLWYAGTFGFNDGIFYKKITL